MKKTIKIPLLFISFGFLVSLVFFFLLFGEGIQFVMPFILFAFFFVCFLLFEKIPFIRKHPFIKLALAAALIVFAISFI